MLADSLEADSRTVMQFVEQVRTANGTLACERDDLETWSYLSRNFADKLRAGVALQTFRLTGQKSGKRKAVHLLRRCLDHWERISAITGGHYHAVPYIDHPGQGNAHKDAETFAWKKYLPQVKRDIAIAEQSTTIR